MSTRVTSLWKMIAGSNLVLIAICFLLGACATPNPNPGERTADIAWENKDYQRALAIIRPRAEAGEPWAQLRLAVAYDLGVGVDKDLQKAIVWYKKVAVRKGDDNWSKGMLVGALGKSGYFNQNSDALVAQYQLAKIYYEGIDVSRELPKAYLLVKNVAKETGGQDIFYCCESVGGRYITASMISDLLKKIETDLSPLEQKAAEEILPQWTPATSL